MELKFYVCEHCGNMVEMVKSSGVPMMCCGQKMTEIIPGTVDAAREKHVPVYEVNGNAVLVRVGAVEHPMQDVHYIEWIALQTRQGVQRRRSSPPKSPKQALPFAKGTRWLPRTHTAICMGFGRRNIYKKTAAQAAFFAILIV